MKVHKGYNMDIEIGKEYGYGRLTRVVLNVEKQRVYYRSSTGREGDCGVVVFEEWVRLQERDKDKKRFRGRIRKNIE